VQTGLSRFTLRLDREIDNDSANPSTSDAVSVIRDRVALNWRHEWSSRVSHVAGLALDNLNRACPSADESTTSARYEINVNIRRWLTIGANGQVTNRSSDECPNSAEPSLDFERQIIGAHIRATL